MVRKRPVCLKDIAKELNTTVNTVSHALRDLPDISEAMKERVRRTANELGYIPNSVAVSLKNNRTSIIGLVFDNMMNPYFSIMSDRIIGGLVKNGYKSMIIPCYKAIFNADFLRDMLSNRIDGIITFIEPTQDAIDLSIKIGVPIMVLGREVSDKRVDCVFTNDFKGGYLAGQYLATFNFKNYAYLGPYQTIECGRRRCNGFIQALNQNNIEFDYDNILTVEYSNTDYTEKAEILFQKDIKGVFCFNDEICSQMMLYLRREHPEFYKTLRFVGYDAISANLKYFREINSINYNKMLIADKAVEILIKRLQKGFENEGVQMEFPVSFYAINN